MQKIVAELVGANIVENVVSLRPNFNAVPIGQLAFESRHYLNPKRSQVAGYGASCPASKNVGHEWPTYKHTPQRQYAWR